MGKTGLPVSPPGKRFSYLASQALLGKAQTEWE